MEEQVTIIEGKNNSLNAGSAAKNFKFSYERDLPFLLCVRNATFISNEQMFKTVTRKKLERNRRCFSWRLERLIAANLIDSGSPVRQYMGRVYSITRQGLALLEDYGEGLLSVGSESRTLPNSLQAPHFLELNEIESAFVETGCLVRWRTERELTSRSSVSENPLAKDYDAIADVYLGKHTYRIAVEYERSLKSSSHYKEVRRSLNEEDGMDVILYLTKAVDGVVRLASEFTKPTVPMCFAASWSFRKNGLDTNIMMQYGDLEDVRTLRSALNDIIRIIK